MTVLIFSLRGSYPEIIFLFLHHIFQLYLRFAKGFCNYNIKDKCFSFFFSVGFTGAAFFIYHICGDELLDDVKGKKSLT